MSADASEERGMGTDQQRIQQCRNKHKVPSLKWHKAGHLGYRYPVSFTTVLPMYLEMEDIPCTEST